MTHENVFPKSTRTTLMKIWSLSVVSSVTCVRLSVVYLKVVFIVVRILAYFSST